VNELDALTRDYRTAFLRYLPRREEAALTRGYELGRGAVTAGVSMLDLTRIHHEILLDVLRNTRPEEIIDVASAAAEFLLEVLAIYDMTNAGSFAEADVPQRRPASIRRGGHRPLSRSLACRTAHSPKMIRTLEPGLTDETGEDARCRSRLARRDMPPGAEPA
jgi:hypothetical protein